MTLLPNGRSERAALDDELTAAREFQRLTELYLAKVRALYPQMSRPMKRRAHPRCSSFAAWRALAAGTAETVEASE